MLEPWNDATILPPPVHTVRRANFTGVNDIFHITNTIIKLLSNQSPLHMEAAVCSRLIYKFDKKLRNDIGYKNLKKVNTALRKYLNLNLLKDIQSFHDILPSEQHDCYLPTRQMLEYVLIRIITFSKIMVRICVCCKKASIFYLDRIKRGESHWMSLIPYSLLSHIWSITSALLKSCVQWYANLFKFLNIFEIKGLSFLPNNYQLPVDLVNWLDVNSIDDFGRFMWKGRNNDFIKNTLFEVEDGDSFENILNYVHDNKDIEEQVNDQNLNEILQVSESQVLSQTFCDKGETISRDSFKMSIDTSSTKTPKANYSHNANSIASKNDLENFISQEESFRNNDNQNSLTKHLSFMQWQALKNVALELNENSMIENKKVGKKFKKIWKEKCLEYL